MRKFLLIKSPVILVVEANTDAEALDIAEEYYKLLGKDKAFVFIDKKTKLYEIGEDIPYLKRTGFKEFDWF